MTNNETYESALERLEESLKGYKQSSVLAGVEVLATNNSCEACKKLEGRVFTIDDALRNKILPCKECTYELKEKDEHTMCRCCYAPVVEV